MKGGFVEVQGTGEHGTFDRGELDALLDLAVKGLRELDARAAARPRHLTRSRRGALLLATRSAGKLRELRPLFAAHGIAVIDLVEAGIAETPDEDALEVFATFEENALGQGEVLSRAQRPADVRRRLRARGRRARRRVRAC